MSGAVMAMVPFLRGYTWVWTWNINSDATSLVFQPSLLLGNGWDGSMPVIVTINIAAAATVGSSRASGSNTYLNPFLVTGSFPAGSTCRMNNRGWIVGEGGFGGDGNSFPAGNNASPGGDALVVSSLTGLVFSVDNAGGVIAGGGGGGAGVYSDAIPSSSAGCGGGGGAGVPARDPGQQKAGIYGGPGSYGTKTAGGAGRAQGSTVAGNGGDLGQSGGAGSGATVYGNPGAAGKAVVGNSKITWINTGTRYGAVT